MTKKHEELVEEIVDYLQACYAMGQHDYKLGIGYGKTPRKWDKDKAKKIIAATLSAVRNGRLGQFKEVLKKTEHELTTLHGLVVCDGFKAYHKAQRSGADPEGAWNSFVEETWQIDTGEALGVIGAALRPLTRSKK